MADQLQHEKTIFHAARVIASAEQRSAYLAQACGEDHALRERIDALLKVYETEPSRDGDAAPVGSALFEKFAPSVDEPPGTIIGRYKLLERIGEGGFGVVYMAEQHSPIRRQVALKVIKAGLDTKQVIARFEAERQALAMMDHENIAKVLDAGANEAGRPYFVMELVHGVPITQYCDDNQLTPRARLELFVQVCRAVQHAHTKGIIHRDIKPTNVLVTLHDGRPLPKVIDFGVAKATGQQPLLTDRTLFTQFVQMVGTPLYMSPEQAEMSGSNVDTRSDVYSLGVLLYELLTGTTPFAKERLKQAAVDEVRRIIREEEPPKPSTRLSTVATLASIAASRGIDPRKLGGVVRGELDWIVMKALEKDRSRRYETAIGLSRDVERYLHNEPVEASSPSAVYRLRKFVRRNRAAVAVAAIVAVSVLVAVAGIAAGVGMASRDRAARQARVSGQLEIILDEVEKLERAEKWSEALTSARRAEMVLATGDSAPGIQARARQALADLKLVQRVEDARARSGTVWADGGTIEPLAVRANKEYTAAFRESGIDVDTLSLNEAAERITARRAIVAALLPAMDDWVVVRKTLKDETATRRLIDLLDLVDPDTWRRQVRDALARGDRAALDTLARSPDLERQPAATLSALIPALTRYHGLFETELLRRVQRKHPGDYWINVRLGMSLVFLPHHAHEGMGYLRAAMVARPDDSMSVMGIGCGYFFLREYEQAIAYFRQSLEIRPGVGAYTNLAVVLGQAGQYDEAIAAFEQSLKLNPRGDPETYAEFAMALSNRPESPRRDPSRAAELAMKSIELDPNGRTGWTALGVTRYRQGQWSQARAALNKSLELGGVHGGFLRSADECAIIDELLLAMSSWQLGERDEARQYYQKAIEHMERDQSKGNDLIRFRAEAQHMLGLPTPPASQPATAPTDKQ